MQKKGEKGAAKVRQVRCTPLSNTRPHSRDRVSSKDERAGVASLTDEDRVSAIPPRPPEAVQDRLSDNNQDERGGADAPHSVVVPDLA